MFHEISANLYSQQCLVSIKLSDNSLGFRMMTAVEAVPAGDHRYLITNKGRHPMASHPLGRQGINICLDIAPIVLLRFKTNER